MSDEENKLLRQLTPAQWRQLRVRRVTDAAQILAMINKKGGSGKTTTTVSLAAIFAAWGARVRKSDGDAQWASSTYWLPPQTEGWKDQGTLLEVFEGSRSIDEVTYPTSVEGVWIVPSLENLGKLETERPPGTDLLLQNELDDSEMEFDLELFDAPPSMGTVTVSMMAAATDLMLTLKASGLDHVGTAEIAKPIAIVQRRLNADLRVSAVTLVDTDETTILNRRMTAQMMADFPDALHTTIPHSVRASEAPAVHQPLLEYAPDNPVTLAYCRLAAGLVPRLGLEWEVGPADLVKAA